MASELPGYRSQRLYTQILNRIRRTYRPGDRLGTQVELAKQYKVSVQTMQRVLATLAGQGWIVRSRRSGTFVAPRPAQAGRNVLWLLDVPRRMLLATKFYRDLLACVAYSLTEAGMTLRISNSSQDKPARGAATEPGMRLQAQLDGLDLAEVDALVVLEPATAAPLASLADAMPVIAIESPNLQRTCSTVCVDHQSAVKIAMDRLDSIGHRRVGFWGMNFAGQAQRTRICYQAYLELIARAKRVPDRQWLSILEGTTSYDQSAEQFLRSDSRPTALLVCGAAAEAARSLRARGVAIGRDVSIIAVGDTGEPTDYLGDDLQRQDSIGGMSLATFQADLATLGRLVAEETQHRLTDAMAGRRTLVAPVIYRDGESCRPPIASGG